MKLAYFDCQFGAAGDMLCAALIDAGVRQDEWLSLLSKIALPPGSFTVCISKVERGTIACSKIDVSCPEHDEERHLSEILSIIESSAIGNGAKDLASRIFKTLARAESKVHGLPVESVHFHEVGAIDAIVDIIGFAIACELLAIDRCYTSSVPLGSGTVKTAHGVFPVPGPAVLNLLSEAGAPTHASEIDYECLTPTGAAILTTVSHSWGPQPALARIYSTGYGAGTKVSPRWPNAVRVLVAEANESEAGKTSLFDSEQVSVVEANLDDFSAQALAYTVERLFEAGALDVTVTPTIMKKGRSGQIVTVICRPEDRMATQELLICETTTLGARAYDSTRLVARRQWRPVSLNGGQDVRIKVALDKNGKVVNAAPEFEDCAAYARQHNLPIKDVLAEAAARFRQTETGGSF